MKAPSESFKISRLFFFFFFFFFSFLHYLLKIIYVYFLDMDIYVDTFRTCKIFLANQKHL